MVDRLTEKSEPGEGSVWVEIGRIEGGEWMSEKVSEDIEIETQDVGRTIREVILRGRAKRRS